MTATVDNAVADLQRANVELKRQLDERTAERDEALEQQTATAEVLQVINSSPGDLIPVFAAMLEKAMRLCEAAFGIMFMVDGDRIRIVAEREVPKPLSDYLVEHPPEIGLDTLLGRSIHARKILHTADPLAGEPYRAGVPLAVKTVELGNVRALLMVPLLKDNEVLGVFAIFRQEARAFSDKQIALLENFAAQAVIAMENARLVTETREALEQQTATAEVLGVINASLGDLAPVFEAILEKAHSLCGAAHGTLTINDGGRFRAVATHGVPEAFVTLLRQPFTPAPGGGIDRLMRGERLVHVSDLTAGDTRQSADPIRQAAIRAGVRTLLFVPLRKDGALLGHITAHREEVRPFSDKQIALLENFAAQAVIAMENARLITGTREALDQQTATAEVLQVINSSPGDLGPVFEAMLEKALDLCSAAFGVLWTYDGDFTHAAAIRGATAAYREFLNVPQRPGPGSAQLRLMEGERFVHVADLADSDDYRSGHALPRALVDLGGGRALLAVPLRKDGAYLGAIMIYRQEPRPFSDKQIALLQNFAAQAVIAMENARLITETQEALDQQTATAEVLQVINSSPGDLTPVFDAMLEKALRLCEAACGHLYTHDGERFHPTVMRGDASFAEWWYHHGPVQAVPGGGFLGRMLQGERVISMADVKESVGYSTAPAFKQLVDASGLRSGIGIALRNDNALLGAITIYRQEVRPFTEKQIALMQNFAAQAVIAMENARLLDEIQQRQAELRVTFDNMADGVVMFDEELRLAAWNRNFQELLDLPDVVLAERPSYGDYLRILAERGEFGADDIEAELGRRLQVTHQELRLERTRPDGRVIEERRNAVPDGGFVLIYSDITERKRSEAEIRAARDTAEGALRDLKAAQANLIQAEKMASLGQLTAGIAHEIKNPLNFVNNFASLSVELLEELKETTAPALATLEEEKRVEADDTMELLTGNLEKIAEHGKRADNIVKSMLEHSRGVTGERREVDLNALIEEALNLAYHGARAHDQSFNITLEQDYALGMKPIELAPQEITRVFLNLFGNGFYAAAKRARENGGGSFRPSLTVATSDIGDAVEVRVRDNGTGIPTEIKDKLFQPFFTTKPTGEGTGLGLSISYDIVTQQHGGTITVESELGAYTEFTVRLPRQ